MSSVDANLVERFESRGLSVSMTTGRIQALFRRAPRLTWKHVRDAVGGMFGSHRREWLARTQVQMEAMRAESPSARRGLPGGFAKARTFFYRVYPASKTPPPGKVDLSDISGESFTVSQVALGLEKGGTFRARGGQRLALPIGITLDKLGRPKPRWSRPELFVRGKSAKELVSFPRRRGQAPILWWRKRSGRGGKTVQYLPAFLLVRQVRRKARLRFMATWDELTSDRDRRLRVAADRIIQGIDRGEPA